VINYWAIFVSGYEHPSWQGIACALTVLVVAGLLMWLVWRRVGGGQ
jgi:uncharacterized membrane protein YwaF